MEKTYEKAEELITNIKSYINLRIDGLKLEIAEKTAEIVTNLIVSSVVFIVFLLFIIFASIALAYGLGEWLEKTWLGFLIVSCGYMFIGIITLLLKDKLIKFPLMNGLIKQFYKNEEAD